MTANKLPSNRQHSEATLNAETPTDSRTWACHTQDAHKQPRCEHASEQRRRPRPHAETGPSNVVSRAEEVVAPD